MILAGCRRGADVARKAAGRHSHAAPLVGFDQVWFLEGELSLSLDDSVSGLEIGVSEFNPWSGLCQDAVLVKLQFQTGVTLPVERTNRVVQEVIAREPELQLPAFGVPEDEVLEHREIAVEEPWSGCAREDEVPILSGRNER